MNDGIDLVMFLVEQKHIKGFNLRPFHGGFIAEAYRTDDDCHTWAVNNPDGNPNKTLLALGTMVISDLRERAAR